MLARVNCSGRSNLYRGCAGKSNCSFFPFECISEFGLVFHSCNYFVSNIYQFMNISIIICHNTMFRNVGYGENGEQTSNLDCSFSKSAKSLLILDSDDSLCCSVVVYSVRIIEILHPNTVFWWHRSQMTLSIMHTVPLLFHYLLLNILHSLRTHQSLFYNKIWS